MSYLTYNELILLPTFEERFRYLQQNGGPSEITFGGHRLLNQMLYKSPVWKKVRDLVILRDNGCDLGIEDRPLQKYILVHHLNPLTIEQVANNDPCVYDLNNLITCSRKTHNSLHYGDLSQHAPTELIERKPGDTRLW